MKFIDSTRDIICIEYVTVKVGCQELLAKLFGNMEGLRLTRLEIIDLSNNQVSTFSFMQNLPKLKEITLRENPMKERAVKRTESTFKNLEKIRLSSTHSAKSVIVPVPPDCTVLID